MQDMLHLFVVAIGLSAGLAIITVWAPRKVWVKVSAIAVATAFLPAAYASLSLLLSRPKPVSLEWARRAATEATVVGASYQEGKAIFLWLRFGGMDEPRAYTLPWSQRMAEQLNKAQQEAKKGNGQVRVRLPFRRGTIDGARKFYARPQAPRPSKPAPGPPPSRFLHPTDRS